MVNQGSIPPAGPPPYYWTARGMATMRAETIKAFGKGIDRAADDFVAKLDVMQDALGLIKNPDPSERLLAYYNKPDTFQEALLLFNEGMIKVVYSWETQQAYFPRDWQEDWTDFQKLRVRAAKGDFGTLFQAQELAYASGEGQQEGADVSAAGLGDSGFAPVPSVAPVPGEGAILPPGAQPGSPNLNLGPLSQGGGI